MVEELKKKKKKNSVGQKNLSKGKRKPDEERNSQSPAKKIKNCLVFIVWYTICYK